MDILKRHLFSIICGLVAIAAIALGVLGIQSMSKVTDEMGEATQLSGRLQQLGTGRGGPVNEDKIDAEQRRVDQIQAHYEQVLAWAAERNRREPLVPGVLPDPDRDQKLEFRRAYQEKLEALLEMLQPGTVASDQDIEDTRIEIQEEETTAEAFGLDTEEAAAEAGATGEEESKPVAYPSGLLTDYGARVTAAARANIAKAHQFRCYADQYSLERFDAINEGPTPDEFDMWNGQLSLWIQEDVVRAIAALNEREAQKLEQAGEPVWVGNMPVKELLSIASSPYVRDEDAGRAPARPSDTAVALPPATPAGVFTHSATNDLYEVVQFTVKVVVDVRRLPELINEICGDGFHTLLRVAYVDMATNPANWSMEGKIYGPHPAVKVVLDFETIFLGDLYRPLMPDVVREDLGLPERDEDEA